VSPPRLLLSLPQFPLDRASGAARSTNSICTLLAAAGFSVRALGITAGEQSGSLDIPRQLAEMGIVSRTDSAGAGRVRPELRFDYRCVSYRLLDVGRHRMIEWEKVLRRQFDQMFDDELHSFRPDFVLTYGGTEGDIHRWKRARRQGARVVFSLRNHGYLHPGFFDGVDAVLTPSRYLSERYREAIGVESTAIPPPIEMEDTLAEERDPIFFTMINPAPEKGLMVMARIAEELSLRRPDIAMLVIESRGSGGLLVKAGMAGGFDLRRHQNLMLAPAVPQPKSLYEPTKALIVPSLLEAAGRVVAEAMLNGIPPLVSDRGGLPEQCEGAGFVLPLPPDLPLDARRPVEKEVVDPWVDLIIRLEDDEPFYRSACEAALRAAERFRPEVLGAEYVRYFKNLL
jgi:glycosyltransferase involved in cell wall biosynthesis